MTYNGRSFKDFRVHRTAGYIEQEDVHMGELTVRETFDFAARCMGADTKKGELSTCIMMRLSRSCWSLLTCSNACSESQQLHVWRQEVWGLDVCLITARLACYAAVLAHNSLQSLWQQSRVRNIRMELGICPLFRPCQLEWWLLRRSCCYSFAAAEQRHLMHTSCISCSTRFMALAG